MARTSRQRRGVLLLVVLSLLIVFLLIAVTFVVVANQQQQAAKAASRMNQVGTDPRQLADGALMQLLRDRPTVDAPRSSIYGHSLLEDVYGRADTFSATVQSTTWLGTTGNQFVELEINTALPILTWQYSSIIPAGAPWPYVPSRRNDFYNGCVLTVVSGEARGATARVVDYRNDGVNPPVLTVMFLPDENHMAIAPLNNARFIVNGRPFAGTGMGYNPATGMLDLKDPTSIDSEYALMPNWTGHNVSIPETRMALTGGANESYDAADYQNMFLALEVPNPDDPIAAVARVIPSFHRPALLNYWINGPRPAAQKLPPQLYRATSPTERRLLRKVLFRPNPVDHPNFPGNDPSGPLWDPVDGPWDVDNNNDGVVDSIWVDLGYPVVRTPDGRAYKPLFAILCTDLDGRFNLNAHGNLVQVDPTRTGVPQPSRVLFAGGKRSDDTTNPLPRGEGYGPAEIHMGPGFGDLFLPGNLFPAGDYLTRFSQRRVGSPGANYWRSLPGAYGAVSGSEKFAFPGQRSFDPLAVVKFRGYPTFASPSSAFSTPADLNGRFAMGLDDRGLPYFEAINDPFRGAENSPYELNLFRSGARGEFDATADPDDTPFTAAELERVLRAYDADAPILPGRLAQLWEDVFQSTSPQSKYFPANRREVTTDSFDVPAPAAGESRELFELRTYVNDRLSSFGTTPYVRTPIPPPHQVSDLLTVRLLYELIGNGGTPGRIDDNGNGEIDETEYNAALDFVSSQLQILMPPEMLRGLPMDVNRLFGNGRDDNGNMTVDEPFDWIPNGEPLPFPQPPDGTTAVTVGMDHTNGIDVNRNSAADDAHLARQLYAQHLYVLMMLLTNAHPDHTGFGYSFPLDPRELATGVTPEQRRELTARRIAQWAINVVDFRDADAIMSAFEYDVNPFNGWTVDGDPRTDERNDRVDNDGDGSQDGRDPKEQERRVVWGCEYPHLLLTETCAFHDTRLVDSDEDDGERKTRDDDDKDLDQYRIPQGSFFAELYCTGNPHNSTLPRELYRGGRLELDKLAGGASKDGIHHPVWRLVISESHPAAGDSVQAKIVAQPESTSLEPNMPNDVSNDFSFIDPNKEVAIERVVWFTSSSPAGSKHSDKTYYNRGGSSAAVPPGGYAVVGPREVTRIGVKHQNTLSDKSDDTRSSHMIRLEPGAPIDPVLVTDNLGNRAYPTSNIQPPVAIIAEAVIDRAPWAGVTNKISGVNISEPLFSSLSYYPPPNHKLLNFPDKDAYLPILDEPLDYKTTAGGGRIDAIPLSKDEDMHGFGTRENYRTVFLQRLANPLLPWNPPPGPVSGHHEEHSTNLEVNPYITVDWMPVDLTVFTGEAVPTGGTVGNDWNPPQLIDANMRDARFRSRERSVNNPNSNNLWRTETYLNPNDSPNRTTENYYRFELDHTLGYWNDMDETDMPNRPDRRPLPGGDPDFPFPWLTWNDRPFISQYELMMVPSSSPARLLFEYTMSRRVDSQAPDDKPYAADRARNDQDKFVAFRAPFRHLFNFYHASMNRDTAAHLYRVFDHTHVPSRFVGTETVLNPTAFTGGHGTDAFHPPFNKVSNYREPGKVNINTITSERLWQGGILHRNVGNPSRQWHPATNAYVPNSGHGGPAWFGTAGDPGLVDSRRGYPGMGIFALNNDFPTFFANPLRSPDAGDLVPLPNMRRPGVEATLLRSNGDPTNPQPLFGAELIQRYNHSDRNPYFRYQSIQRLGNMVTTRSNVYAVWITVGFFEAQRVDTAPFPLAERIEVYPDGYMLGPEIGSDVGDVKRHRGFYIIDRSIPVAFEPGKNHNVENTILLRRFIE